MLDQFTVQKLRDLPIEGVAERLGLEVHRHKSLCPFHNDTRPSLTFNIRKNTYKCFVCESHGGTIDLVMHRLGKSFAEACRWLADQSNVVLESWRPLPKPYTINSTPSADIRHLSQLVCQPYLCDEAKRFLFEERKIRPEVVRQLGLSSISSPVPMSGDLNGSWFNAPSLLIPYRDIDGNLLSVQARYLGEKVPRFQFPKGSHCGIFNLPAIASLKEKESLFITEGVTDCLAMLSAGFKSIAIPSATLLKSEDLKHLGTLNLKLGTTFHMFPDRDAPGERLFLDLKELLETPSSLNPTPSTLVRHQLPEGFKDVGQYYSFIHKDERP